MQRTPRLVFGTGWGRRVGLLLLAVAGLIPGGFVSGQETVRSLAELRALPSETALRRLPVEVSGVILYADSTSGDVMIHDGTASCYCYRGALGPEAKVGDRVRVEGRSTSEGLFPHLLATSLVVLGQAERPPPHLLGPDEIYLPEFDSGWIEVPAIVMGAEPDGLAYTLVVEVFGQTFKADVPRTPDMTPPPGRYSGASPAARSAR